MRINVDLADLRAFALLARLGHFSRTAEALAITPSALSRRIAKLEAALGGRLLERTTRSVALAPAGVDLHGRLAHLLESLDDSLAETARRLSGQQGRIVVACFASLAGTLFPDALARLHERYPDVRVNLRDGSGTYVLHSVLKREAAFGLTTLVDDHPELVIEGIDSDRYVLACPPDHPFASRRSLTWRELAAHRVLSFNAGGASRQQIDPILRSEGIALPWFDEIDQLSSMLGHLRHGGFIAVLPGSMAELALPAVCVPLRRPDIERRIVLVRRRDVTLGPSAAWFWALLAEGAGRARPKREGRAPRAR